MGGRSVQKGGRKPSPAAGLERSLRRSQGTLSQTDPGGPGESPARSGPRAREAECAPETQPSCTLPVFGFIWEPPEGVPAACRFMRCGGSGRGWRHRRRAGGGDRRMLSSLRHAMTSLPPQRSVTAAESLPWPGPDPAPAPAASVSPYTLWGGSE